MSSTALSAGVVHAVQVDMQEFTELSTSSIGEAMLPESESIDYTDGQSQFTGYLVSRGNRSGILIFHGGAGLDEHARGQAERYAELGHTVLAADLYGLGLNKNRETVMAAIGALQADRDLLVRRADAAAQTLRRSLGADAPIAVVGFCFGGMAALQYVRGGGGVAAAVSMHGSLTTKQPAQPGVVAAQLLVCHGAADPHVPMEQVTAFAAEMSSAGATWEVVIYGGVQHGFTHRDAVGDAARNGIAYNERADRLSFARASEFLRAALAP
jgi:dienelactone hydrolase